MLHFLCLCITRATVDSSAQSARSDNVQVGNPSAACLNCQKHLKLAKTSANRRHTLKTESLIVRENGIKSHQGYVMRDRVLHTGASA